MAGTSRVVLVPWQATQLIIFESSAAPLSHHCRPANSGPILSRACASPRRRAFSSASDHTDAASIQICRAQGARPLYIRAHRDNRSPGGPPRKQFALQCPRRPAHYSISLGSLACGPLVVRSPRGSNGNAPSVSPAFSEAASRGTWTWRFPRRYNACRLFLAFTVSRSAAVESTRAAAAIPLRTPAKGPRRGRLSVGLPHEARRKLQDRYAAIGGAPRRFVIVVVVVFICAAGYTLGQEPHLRKGICIIAIHISAQKAEQRSRSGARRRR